VIPAEVNYSFNGGGAASAYIASLGKLLTTEKKEKLNAFNFGLAC